MLNGKMLKLLFGKFQVAVFILYFSILFFLTSYVLLSESNFEILECLSLLFLLWLSNNVHFLQQDFLRLVFNNIGN